MKLFLPHDHPFFIVFVGGYSPNAPFTRQLYMEFIPVVNRFSKIKTAAVGANILPDHSCFSPFFAHEAEIQNSQLLFALFIIRAPRTDKPPERRRMIHVFKMRKLMDNAIINRALGRHNEKQREVYIPL